MYPCLIYAAVETMVAASRESLGSKRPKSWRSIVQQRFAASTANDDGPVASGTRARSDIKSENWGVRAHGVQQVFGCFRVKD